MIMTKELADIKGDIQVVVDRGESVIQMEPLLISESAPLRVCPRTSSGITEFSQHEAD